MTMFENAGRMARDDPTWYLIFAVLALDLLTAAWAVSPWGPF